MALFQEAKPVAGLRRRFQPSGVVPPANVLSRPAFTSRVNQGGSACPMNKTGSKLPT